jgi:tetratricopeptide (TPR) repeat protein
MRKTVLLLAIILLISNALLAQVEGGKNKKLRKLWDKEKYEDVGYKCLNYLDRDRKDLEANLYYSMAMLELHYSDNPKIQEYYDDAMKDALKYAGKYMKYSEEDRSLYEKNLGYFLRLEKAAVEEAKKYMEEDDYRRATYIYRYLLDVYPNDPHLLMMRGVIDAYNNNTFDAERNITDAMKQLHEVYAKKVGQPRKPSQPVLEDAFVMYSELLNTKGQTDSAKTVITTAVEFLPESEKVKAQAGKLK